MDHSERHIPLIAHIPLEAEGCFVNIWVNKGTGGFPVSVFIPFGAALLLSAHVVHGGCFGSKGASRFHMILKPKESIVKWHGRTLELSGEAFWKEPEKAAYSVIKICQEDPHFLPKFDHHNPENYELRQKIKWKKSTLKYQGYETESDADGSHWSDVDPV